MLKDSNDTNAKYLKKDESTGAISWVDSETEATKFTSSTTDGKVTISGLDSGTYYLHETKAPSGYNKLTEDVTVKVGTEAGSTTGTLQEVLKKGDTKVTQIEVENHTGSEMPSTGGIGTTIFYVIGGILVAGAAVALVVKKRMSSYED